MRKILLMLVVLMPTVNCFASSNDEADLAMQAGRYAQAFNIYNTNASNQDSYAQLMLANIYINGFGLAQDYKEAFKFMEQSANNQNVVAQVNLAVMYANGFGVDKDNGKAVLWLEAAKKREFGIANHYIHLLYSGSQLNFMEPHFRKIADTSKAAGNGYEPIQDQSQRVSKQSNSSIQDAKKKCEYLGFKPKTEKFGDCVLELTK